MHLLMEIHFVMLSKSRGAYISGQDLDLTKQSQTLSMNLKVWTQRRQWFFNHSFTIWARWIL